MKHIKATILAAVLVFSVVFVFFVGLPYFHLNLVTVQAETYSTTPKGCPENSDQSAPADVVTDANTLYPVTGTTILYDGPNGDVIPAADGSALTVLSGQTFVIIGYNDAGDWTKIQIGCSTAWVQS
ncbi:MAG: hypothetical protein GC204_17810 [Chloroflexi bacterium]|nr:hypothetical protein [Chloroflexota bacterium]